MAPPPPPSQQQQHPKLHVRGSALSKLDMYRKVPNDLMEGTKRGSILSWVALSVMSMLFILETKQFCTTRIIRDLMLDNQSDDTRLRINFNITMLDLPCDYTVVDVVSPTGTDQNITTHITKYSIDSDGVRKIYRGRNKQQRDIELDLHDKTVTASIEELHLNGEDAVSLTEETLEFALKENDYVFVDFYASWCSHCRDLAPTWESLAELMVDASEKLGNKHPSDYSDKDLEEATKLELPVMIGKVDCVIEKNLCNQQQQIRAYPTLRLFVDGERWKGSGSDYRGHRTLIEMVEWLYHVEEEHKSHMSESERQLHIAHQAARERLSNGDIDSDEEKRWHDKIVRDKKRLHHQWKEEEHPGCQLSGFLLVERTPGNFHIQARSSNQEFDPSMTNVSHMVNSLMIGDPMVKSLLSNDRKQARRVPESVLTKINPMDGYAYVNEDLHESYHHYLKLVPTQVEGFQTGKRQLRMFQIMSNTQLSLYDNSDGQQIPPEAKFQYDISPIAVTYKTRRTKQWYEYVTSIMAIIGGVFTVVGMFESTIQATITTIIKSRRKSTVNNKSKQHQAQQQESRQIHHNQYHGGS